MHGSSFCGDGGKELRGLAEVMKDVLEEPSYRFPAHSSAGRAAVVRLWVDAWRTVRLKTQLQPLSFHDIGHTARCVDGPVWNQANSKQPTPTTTAAIPCFV